MGSLNFDPEPEERPMHKTKLILALTAISAAAVLVPALAIAGKNTVEVTAKLRGNQEVPGPGDPNGKGEINVFLKAKKEKVCFNLEISKLDPVREGHIHKGPEGEAGKVKVQLFVSEIEGDGAYEGCVKNVKAKLVKKIGEVPEKFYVNLHTAEYPDGAIRGQLSAVSVGA
jgi:hypothetical protein